MNDFHVFCFGFKLQAVLVQAHFVGFKFACMQKVEKKKKNIVHHKGLHGNLTVITSENPLQALAKSPHLTKVGRITQHVHVEQLSQVV